MPIMTIKGMVICKSVMTYQIMNVTSALLARGFQGNINYFVLGFWPVINPCCIKRTVYRLDCKTLSTLGAFVSFLTQDSPSRENASLNQFSKLALSPYCWKIYTVIESPLPIMHHCLFASSI